MGIEIERKFLVQDDSWKTSAGAGLECRQGYLVSSKKKTVRVRIIGEEAFLTVKGESSGITRAEFEYAIPVFDAHELIELCGIAVIEKTRYTIKHGGMTWEIDVFFGANDGLVVAEIELDTESQLFELPPWVGEEVSGDSRYYNACLAQQPYKGWGVSS